jgi:hypothetical protein
VYRVESNAVQQCGNENRERVDSTVSGSLEWNIHFELKSS